MRVSNTNVCHIRYTDTDEHIIALAAEVINETRDIMRACECDLMFNTQTGECITLDEFDRLAGIFSGLADMDEIIKE